MCWLGQIRFCVYGFCALGLLVLGGCGSEEAPSRADRHPDSSPSARAFEITPTPLEELQPLQVTDRPSRHPACMKGEASLGSEPGAIEFEVRCHASSMSSRAGFVITRYLASGRQAASGIKSVQGRPALTGERGPSGSGVCLLLDGSVACYTSERGRLGVHGRMRVAPGSECAMEIGISVIEPARCQDVCELALDMRYLFQGRPVGCAGDQGPSSG